MFFCCLSDVDKFNYILTSNNNDNCTVWIAVRSDMYDNDIHLKQINITLFRTVVL